MRAKLLTLAAAALVAAAAPASALAPPPPRPVGGAFPGCAGQAAVAVPGAERQRVDCLPDLTTAGLDADHTDRSDWNGLHAPGTQNPSGVPGVQVDGYFPDTSTSNSTHGWFHDSQFVIRMPDDWNGGLVVTGAPGIRKQYANDFIISDWAVARGYAFASTDKGNNGTSFHADGATPGDALVEWHRRVTELTLAARQAVTQRYGAAPARTYMTGISNGGYLTRWQIENRPDLYDGAVDWEGTLQTPDVNLLTYLPATLKHYPAYAAGSDAAHQAILDAGFPAGSEFLWDYHYGVYWDLTQRTYREEFDPGYDGALSAGVPFCASGTPACDADYDYAARRPLLGDALAKASLTGDIGKPMLTLHGTLDALLPPSRNSDVYDGMVSAARKNKLHRYYTVEDGNHVDGLHGTWPTQLRPILPCYREAFLALERWVEQGVKPPADATIPRAPGTDEVNTCVLPPQR
ncbi:MAG: tannase/feruloyl esterase family alpha/beta hydrolase [Actinomycetota bacterium]|nr:tannase/feruloyl esterase family alpha/beta hydrolase [Actinomycetota bacterium]